MALSITAEVDRAIRRHGSETYPNECCGALIGRTGVVTEVYALPNTTEEGPRRQESRPHHGRPEDRQAQSRQAQGRKAGDGTKRTQAAEVQEEKEVASPLARCARRTASLFVTGSR